MAAFDALYDVSECTTSCSFNSNYPQKLKEQESSTESALNLVNDMLGMLPFVENMEDAVMKLRVTKDTVKDIFGLIQEASGFAFSLTGKNEMQSEQKDFMFAVSRLIPYFLKRAHFP